MKHEPFNESSEMYLKTVFELTVTKNLVSIATLAERLGVSTVSATEMVHRLQQQNLLRHVPYKGVSLTDAGQQAARQLMRAHRLWECFLAGPLKLPWEAVHNFACRLEHATDTAVTTALADFLDHPTTCPHGNLIPKPAGETAVSPTDQPLTSLQPGQSGTVSRISPESDNLLAYAASLKIKPNVTVTVKEIAPFNGPIMLQVGEQTHALGQKAAAHFFVHLPKENA